MKDEEHDVVSLELFRRQLEDANPDRWFLDQIAREMCAGIRMQAGLSAKVLPFRRGK
ncbi:MAG: hypothetical protein WCH04_07455 [Gammaproteobacteria bacterium]